MALFKVQLDIYNRSMLKLLATGSRLHGCRSVCIGLEAGLTNSIIDLPSDFLLEISHFFVLAFLTT